MIDPGSVVGHMLKQAEQNTFEKKNSVSHGNWSFYMVIIKTWLGENHSFSLLENEYRRDLLLILNKK